MVAHHRYHPSKTIPIRHPRPELARIYKTNLPTDHWRPRHRCECINGPRPCPFFSCRFNLYIDVNAAGGIVLNFPGKRLQDLEETCALDVAANGEHTLDEVGKFLNLTRERIRQIETVAMCSFPDEMKEYASETEQGFESFHSPHHGRQYMKYSND